MADDNITLKTVLDHMQNMQTVLTQEIRQGDQSLARRIDDLDKRLSTRIDHLQANLTTQIDGIDKRLDEMEIQKLPNRVAKLEVAVGIA
jgi:hypothetical protein